MLLRLMAKGKQKFCVFVASLLFVVVGNSQVITTVAGNGLLGFSGDGGLAINATLKNTSDVSVDANNNIYIADINNFRIRKVNLTTGIISTYAGNGLPGPGLEGVSAINGSFYPYAVTLDKNNNLYITDETIGVIKKVDATTNIITRVAGSGAVFGPSGPGMQALSTSFLEPYHCCIDKSGNIYIADRSYGRIRKVDAVTGITSNVAGNGTNSGGGDGGPATSASLRGPEAVCIDPAGNLYIMEVDSYKIRKVDAVTGIITTFAGTGVHNYSGDGGLAVNAQIGAPSSITSDIAGNIYFGNDAGTIHKVDAVTGIITLIAGTGVRGNSPDGTPALTAMLSSITGMCIDSKGDLYFSDGVGNL